MSGVVQALVSHCEQWVAKFSLLLHDIASTELAELYTHFERSTAALAAPPSNLDELAAVVQLQRKLDAERPQLAARFEPLQHMFATLEKVRWHTNVSTLSTQRCMRLCNLALAELEQTCADAETTRFTAQPLSLADIRLVHAWCCCSVYALLSQFCRCHTTEIADRSPCECVC